MNGFTRKPWRIGGCGLLWVGPMLVAVSSMGFGRALAAPIHKTHELADVDRQSFRTWPEYVLGGPTVWSSVPHPPLTAGIEQAIRREIRADPSESNPVVQFFQFRQDLAPRRFDHYHPRLALELHNIVAAAEAQQAAASPSATTSPSTTTDPSLQAQELGPGAQIPEPATLWIAVGMVGYALWRRHRA
jgi:hypothetical protein